MLLKIRIMKIIALFKSRRFWLMLGGIGAAVTSTYFPGAEGIVTKVLGLLSVWIVGDSIRVTSQEFCFSETVWRSAFGSAFLVLRVGIRNKNLVCCGVIKPSFYDATGKTLKTEGNTFFEPIHPSLIIHFILAIPNATCSVQLQSK